MPIHKFTNKIGKPIPLVYDNGFEPTNIIGHHDKKIKQIIINQLLKMDTFIDTAFIKFDKDLNEVLELSRSQGRRLICYSGPDWNNSHCPPHEHHPFAEQWAQLDQSNVLHVGNTIGQHYFSFWLDFVYTHLDMYEQFDPYDLQLPLKHFMCLNRKPHRPRVELYNILMKEGLIKYGHTSLGERAQLPKDIINAEGDAAVQGDVGITNDISSLGHKDNWNSHFLNVVTETTVYTDVFITEKTFKPIIGRRPFIILGDKNIYRLLKDWGFDTFDDLFGKGYNQPEHEDRTRWIVNVVKDLSSRSDLDTLLLELKPRLEHNYQTFLKVAEINRENLQHLLDK